MRKLTVVAAMAFALFTGNVLANDVNPNIGKVLTEHISKLLSENDFENAMGTLAADVRFTLNADGEIVVLSVATDNERLEHFVKTRLNYQKVNVLQYEEGKIYKIPVRVEL